LSNSEKNTHLSVVLIGIPMPCHWHVCCFSSVRKLYQSNTYGEFITALCIKTHGTRKIEKYTYRTAVA